MCHVPDPGEWLSVPEVAEVMQVRQRDVRQMLADKKIVAVRRGPNNAWYINAGQLIEKDGRVVAIPALRGTLISLSDAGYSAAESLNWLTTVDAELGQTPLETLRSGKIHAVRRVIAGLAF
ncbi:MAG: Rv2175c family DNA-binding protein [Trueperella sp.]|nr:Rv2175c family DNA-binding protein [Trueperella sp.]